LGKKSQERLEEGKEEEKVMVAIVAMKKIL
jgi:hypothetical protein